MDLSEYIKEFASVTGSISGSIYPVALIILDVIVFFNFPDA
jgi:hypothetical protein